MLGNTQIKINTTKVRDTIMNFIVPLVSVAITGVLVALVIYPSVQSLPQLNSDLASKKTLRAQLETKVGVLNKLQDYKSVVEEDLELIEDVLVSEDSVPFLLNQIDTIARNSGLNLNRLNYGVGNATSEGEGAQKSEILSVAVNMGATGTYNQLISFLENVEKAARFISVSNFRYSSGEQTPGDFSNLSLSCLLYSPYLDVNSSANTDDPILLDITSKEFTDTINQIKSFTFYENSLAERPVLAEEKPLEELELPVEEELPGGDLFDQNIPTPESSESVAQ